MIEDLKKKEQAKRDNQPSIDESRPADGEVKALNIALNTRIKGLEVETRSLKQERHKLQQDVEVMNKHLDAIKGANRLNENSEFIYQAD